MASRALSDKEQALIAAARRELRGRSAGAQPPVADKAHAPTTPLDQPTVLGWDHPAAQAAPPAVAADKWAAIAAMMENERRAEGERRARLRQRTLYVMLAVLLLLLAGMTLGLRG